MMPDEYAASGLEVAGEHPARGESPPSSEAGSPYRTGSGAATVPGGLRSGAVFAFSTLGIGIGTSQCFNGPCRDMAA